MARAVAVLFPVLLVALLLQAPFAVAQKTTVKVVQNGGPIFHTEAIAPNTIKTFTVTCPPGHFAFGGAVSTPGKGVTVLKSTPGPGGTSWVFTIGSPVTNGPDFITVQVNCFKPTLPGVGGKVKLTLKAKKSKLLTIPPGGTGTAKVTCPDDSAPAAPGDEQQVPAGPKSSPPRGRAAQSIPSPGQAARWTSVHPVRGGFEFTAKNPDPTSARTVRGIAECVSRRATGGRRGGRRRRAQVEVLRSSASTVVRPGFQTLFQGCRRGHVPLSGGWSYASSADILVLASALDRALRFFRLVQNGTQQPQPVDLFVLCTRGRITFDRGRPPAGP